MEGFKPVRLSYSTHEPVGGPDKNLSPVIFLHAFSAFKETWEDIPQITANATKRLCYSVDARNHGDSEWSDEFSFDLNVNDLIHFMDSQGIKKAILVGQSMGGITTIRTALKEPNRVEKIVLEDVPVQPPSQQALDMVLGYLHGLRQAVEEAPATLDEDGVKKFIVQHILAQMPQEMKEMIVSQDQDPYRMTRFIGLKKGANGRYTFKCNMEVISKSIQDKEALMSQPKGVFEGPACFIFGKKSPFFETEDHDKTKQLFPNAVVEVIEEAGHDIRSTKPLEFKTILLKFLS